MITGCSRLAKAMGFKSTKRLAELAGVSRKEFERAYEDRKLMPLTFYGHVRRAMDQKQLLERIDMEAAIAAARTDEPPCLLDGRIVLDGRLTHITADVTVTGAFE